MRLLPSLTSFSPSKKSHGSLHFHPIFFPIDQVIFLVNVLFAPLNYCTAFCPFQCIFAIFLIHLFYKTCIQNTFFRPLYLIPYLLASSTLQIIAGNLQSCTETSLLFNWDFLIHTFSPLTAPTVKHYQKEQTICACITSYYHLSLFHLKLTDGSAVMFTGSSLVVVFICIQDTFTCSKICLRVRGVFLPPNV